MKPTSHITDSLSDVVFSPKTLQVQKHLVGQLFIYVCPEPGKCSVVNKMAQKAVFAPSEVSLSTEAPRTEEVCCDPGIGSSLLAGEVADLLDTRSRSVKMSFPSRQQDAVQDGLEPH